jgi:hypothetical protein
MSGVTDRDFIQENFLEQLADAMHRLAALERLVISTGAADVRYLRRVMSNADVSSPATAAELDIAFGPAATLPNPFIALVDDDGAGTDVYLVCALNVKWWGEILTELT